MCVCPCARTNTHTLGELPESNTFSETDRYTRAAAARAKYICSVVFASVRKTSRRVKIASETPGTKISKKEDRGAVRREGKRRAKRERGEEQDVVGAGGEETRKTKNNLRPSSCCRCESYHENRRDHRGKNKRGRHTVSHIPFPRREF